jgi:uncharacterized membrane protein YgcG
MQAYLRRMPWKSFFALILFVTPLPTLAAEVIKDFRVTAVVRADRHLVVEEVVTYDFGDTERHGIYRDIPVRYVRNGTTFLLRLNVERVMRDGQDEPYETSRDGNDLSIKIGDPDRTIVGPHTYSIRYSTDRAILFLDDGRSELYWNVTGNEWQVPIERSSFEVIVPTGLDPENVVTACYTGELGSQAQDCSTKQTASGFAVQTSRVLLMNEGLTAAFTFPPGTIAAPTTSEWAWMVLQDNGILFLPLCALLIMHWLWWTKGKDPEKMTVVPEYESPRKLSPAVIGSAVTNGNVPKGVATATIIDLARRGYLHIRFGEEKKLFGASQTFTFVKKKDADDTLTPYEVDILNGLFAGGDEQTLEDLKQSKFYTAINHFTSDVQKEITDMKVFISSPTSVRGIFIGVAVVMCWSLFAFTNPSLFEAVAIFATGLIIIGYGWFMPRRTLDGVKLLAQIHGFKWFLSVTEKDRLAFTDAPARTPEQFQKFLPYAIALGVEAEWARQFASIHMNPPTWAEGNMAGFHPMGFASSMRSLDSSARSIAYPAPSSSGGGSGGGMGGGGGGSW